MKDYQKLDVWKKSHALALELYRTVARSVDGADAALAASLRHAACQVPTRIVRACGQAAADDFARGMHGAEGATDDLRYLLVFARDAGVLGAVPFAKLEARANQLHAMLGGFNRTLRRTLEGAAVAPRRVPESGSSRPGSRR